MAYVPGYIQVVLPAWGRLRIENETLYLNDARVLGLTPSEKAIKKFGTRIS